MWTETLVTDMDRFLMAGVDSGESETVLTVFLFIHPTVDTFQQREET